MSTHSNKDASAEHAKLESEEAQARIAKLLAEGEALKQQSVLSGQQTTLMVERWNLDKRDGEARIAKTALEKEVLSDQLSRASKWREWLKTLGAAAAILVLLVVSSNYATT